MKRIGLLIVILVLSLTLSACGGNMLKSKKSGTKQDTNSSENQNSSSIDETNVETDGQDEVKVINEKPITSVTTIEFRSTDGKVWITNSDIRTVSLNYSEQNGYYVALDFTEEGYKKFAEATRENVGKAIEIYNNDSLLSSPHVMAEITSGPIIIEGTEDLARGLFDTFTRQK